MGSVRAPEKWACRDKECGREEGARLEQEKHKRSRRRGGASREEGVAWPVVGCALSVARSLLLVAVEAPSGQELQRAVVGSQQSRGFRENIYFSSAPLISQDSMCSGLELLPGTLPPQ